jgi:hypothetical protein
MTPLLILDDNFKAKKKRALGSLHSDKGTYLGYILFMVFLLMVFLATYDIGATTHALS